MLDLHSHIKTIMSVTPAAFTATTTGTAVNRAGYNSLVFSVGVATLGAATITVAFEESVDGLDNWTSIEASRIQHDSAITFANNFVKSYGITAIGNLTKNWIRPVLTVAGGTPTGFVVGVLGDPTHGPAKYTMPAVITDK